MSKDQLFSLLQGFAALAPVKSLKWLSCVSIDETQDFLIEQLILPTHFQSYPPSSDYQKSFWKWVIAKVEEKGEEVREEIYAHYLNILDASPTDAIATLAQPPPSSYVTYLWKDNSWNTAATSSRIGVESFRKCTLFESRTTIESGTTGLRTWTASFVLANYLISHHHLVESSRVLEFGAGAGFLGITIAQMQMEAFDRVFNPGEENRTRLSLCLTDSNEQVLMRCENNVKLPCNNVLAHPDLHFTMLDWLDTLDDGHKRGISTFLEEFNADMIIGADVVYDVSIIPAFVETLRLALTMNPTNQPRRALIAATLRNQSTIDTFTNKVKEVGLQIEDIEADLNGLSSPFLHSQPDVIGENRSHVIMFNITNKMHS